jgi:hypothetical protein
MDTGHQVNCTGLCGAGEGSVALVFALTLTELCYILIQNVTVILLWLTYSLLHGFNNYKYILKMLC